MTSAADVDITGLDLSEALGCWKGFLVPGREGDLSLLQDASTWQTGWLTVLSTNLALLYVLLAERIHLDEGRFRKVLCGFLMAQEAVGFVRFFFMQAQWCTTGEAIVKVFYAIHWGTNMWILGLFLRSWKAQRGMRQGNPCFSRWLLSLGFGFLVVTAASHLALGKYQRYIPLERFSYATVSAYTIRVLGELDPQDEMQRTIVTRNLKVVWHLRLIEHFVFLCNIFIIAARFGSVHIDWLFNCGHLLQLMKAYIVLSVWAYAPGEKEQSWQSLCEVFRQLSSPEGEAEGIRESMIDNGMAVASGDDIEASQRATSAGSGTEQAPVSNVNDTGNQLNPLAPSSRDVLQA